MLMLLRKLRGASTLYLGHTNLAPLAVIAKAMRPRIECHIATHGIELWKPLKTAIRVGLRLCHRVIVTSAHSKAIVATTHGIAHHKVALIPPALDQAFVSMAAMDRESYKPHSGMTILSVGRMDSSERYKGVDTIIDAMSRMSSIACDVHYVAVGNGNDRVRLQVMAQQSPAASRIHFVGSVSEPELAEYYRSCDIFVMPSEREGFGIAFLEAMAFGKPVIGGNHCGTPDLVIHGVNGFLVNHGDTAALARLIVRLAGDVGLRHRLGLNGRQTVEENYTFEHYRRRLGDVIGGLATPGIRRENSASISVESLS